MTPRQRDALASWFSKMIATYNIDFFRGSSLFRSMEAIYNRNLISINYAKGDLHVAIYHGFEADTKDYDDLLKELRQIAKEVPLDNKALTVIKRIFSGDWWGAINALNELDSKHKKTDLDMFGYLT